MQYQANAIRRTSLLHVWGLGSGVPVPSAGGVRESQANLFWRVRCRPLLGSDGSPWLPDAAPVRPRRSGGAQEPRSGEPPHSAVDDLGAESHTLCRSIPYELHHITLYHTLPPLPTTTAPAAAATPTTLSPPTPGHGASPPATIPIATPHSTLTRHELHQVSHVSHKWRTLHAAHTHTQ